MGLLCLPWGLPRTASRAWIAAIAARWGVGYDRVDVAAMPRADAVLSITPTGVRRPVAGAILTFAFALSKNLFALDRMTRAGQWCGALSQLGGDLRGRVLGS